MSTWFNILAVAAGGAAGSVARYLITLGSAAIPGGSTFWGTTTANLLGCLAIGAIGEYGMIEGAISERAKLAIRVGFLGGLTTFSTFAGESTLLAGSGRVSGASWYVGANLIGGWAAVVAGAALVKSWTA